MDDAQKLLRWYNGLYSRTVDLVGDYAGSELFIIEGDSLLLHCFSDDQLQFSRGLQLLHSTYIVERFLAQLHQRNCNFHIVFFSENSSASIPPHVDAQSRPKYRLAREAVLQHLLHNAPQAVPSLQVRCFDRYDSQEFKDYLVSLGAYFLMCHDGAFAELFRQLKDTPDPEDLQMSSDDESSDDDSDDSSDDSSEDTPKLWPTRLTLRSMIHWFICHGYNISLLNSLECRDTKVITTVLEGSAERARQVFQAVKLEVTEDPESSGSDTETEDDSLKPAVDNLKIDAQTKPSTDADPNPIEKTLEKFLDSIGSASSHDLRQREWASVLTVSVMLASGRLQENDALAIRALLLHTVILEECKLGDRVYDPKDSSAGESFLVRYATVARHVISSPSWLKFAATNSLSCDLGDMVDGRLFLETLNTSKASPLDRAFSQDILARLAVLAATVKTLCGSELDATTNSNGAIKKPAGEKRAARGSRQKNPFTVLAFNNSVLNPHLKPISLTVDDSTNDQESLAVSRIFEEISHWHNHRRPLDKRNEGPLPSKLLRRNQLWMAETVDYAASLTNAAGGILEPETVFLRTAKDRKGKPAQTSGAPTPALEQSSRQKPSTSSVRTQAALQLREKQAQTLNKQLKAWESKCRTFEQDSNLVQRYVSAREYLSSLRDEKRSLVEAEILTYLVSTLVRLWKQKCASKERGQSMSVVALIWHLILRISKVKQGITEDIAICIRRTTRALNLPAVDLSPDGTGALSFEFAPLKAGEQSLEIGLSPVEFQLVHAGPYFDRNMDSAPDSRVDFEPDRWQRETLDQIDAEASLFVVAPTSAGKTFISFYAMKQVLEGSDDGVLVYVAPTKALVNQIAAEVQARFKKTFKHGGKSVWAIHTRDYRINEPNGCQILITVPHILQIMLLAPSNAKSWSSRVKRIIFDEIHCIGQAEDGVVWEQLLLLAPCPIIALSATVGNPKAFNSWLSMTQKANGCDLKMIEHKTRWSDLRKYNYNPPQGFVFKGLQDSARVSALGLEDCPNVSLIHPVSSLIDRSRGLPDDFGLEPRDCWTLWNAMNKYKTAEYPLDPALDPAVALPKIIVKADVLGWEAGLKTVLKSWMENYDSPFDAVLKELSEQPPRNAPAVQVSSGTITDSDTPREVKRNSLLETTLPLICSLNDQGALPALFFNYDRSWCEKICQYVLIELQEAETRWKETSSAWARKIAEWEAWKKAEEKRAKHKPAKAKAKGKGGKDDEGTSKADQMRDSASEESSWHASFNPEDPDPRFSLADVKKFSLSELEDYAKELRRRQVPEWLLDALKRGIGIHHAGMNRKYRHVCEILFRKGYLRVVIATGTLALGINMPCKTVVFSGDSVFLTALGFRQAAGRAGRRGFDFLGNVVFQGVSHSKVSRLLSSKLPSLNGHFPITTSLVLRLLILLHESGQSPFAVKAINSILSCPRIYLGGPESKHTVLHHLRFSIEYLRRNHLLDSSGVPLNFAGTISHLYYTENSSFAFHALLSSGYFHRLCRNINKYPTQITRTLMLVLSHLFGRQELRPAVLEKMLMSEKKSPSLVVLPDLPKKAVKILRAHNTKTLNIYSTYVTTFVEQHITEPDCFLPLTQIKCGGDKSPEEISPSMPVSPPTRVASSFVALSGHRDKWQSIPELCKTVRDGVWLEEAVVPYVGIYPEEGKVPLNAYLYDFFKHGNVHALEKSNGVRRGDVWFVLNDFSLVLATIVTSFENFLKLSPGTDLDMIDATGSGDAHEIDLDDKIIDATPDRSTGIAGRPSAPAQAKAQAALAPTPAPVKKKKAKVADSWDDDMSDSSSEEEEEVKPAKLETTPVDKLGDKGFLQVLKAFKLLQEEFNGKFRAMWA
ncbi:DEAD/DEAH box helicase [Aspergillus heteromorphus CBS 117.55]|uniref:DEAD/DEAH box helicase n=1 Tax=Aspergillus heteromorphus CBS 117.55 TaxID=1448321 RepID=A0A317VM81_9EURO|nr:DEAD/DEAH box helicase [Aspergillus heteromorphus CBS 117.55]PWY75483.1 DEAD/DEAH box helicase [Aspergillus heteromorphus CBS 117.55]